jgi:hydroxymethylglutaryl-CoA synthase
MMPDCTVGIAAYGTFIPRCRLAVEEPLRVWQNLFLEILKEQLMISERAVLLPDQDAITMSVEAARLAMRRWGQPREALRALYFGTCTNPYDSRPSSTLIAEAIGGEPWMSTLDLQFSTKSGTAALQVAQAMIASGAVPTAVAIGADAINRHVAPGTIQEYAGSAGAAAFILTRDPDEAIATLGPFTSYMSDLSDAFRLGGDRYIRSGGLSSQESGIGFLEHIGRAVERHLRALGLRPRDLDHVVFQQPFGVVPVALALRLGFGMEQVTQGLVAYELGDLGSAGIGIGLANVLDAAEPRQRILVASYGFGAGADVTLIETTERLAERRPAAARVEQQIRDKYLVDYATAMKFEQKYAKVTHALTAWS